MWPRRSLPTWPSRRAGYSLIEIIIALALGSTVAVAAGAGYLFATRSWQDQRQRLVTEQNLRSAIDLLSRELRLAGACLPDAGPANIRPLAGTDSGTTDTITARANVRCAIGSLRNAAAAGDTRLHLDTVDNFVAAMQVHVLRADTTGGEYVQVTAVNVASRWVEVTPPLAQPYPVASSLYGAEAQTYAIDSGGAMPALTVAAVLGPPQRAVEGIERLDIHYVLNRNCQPGPCDVVDLPASDGEWALVRSIQLDLGARSARPVAGTFYRRRQSIDIKPRNFVH